MQFDESCAGNKSIFKLRFCFRENISTRGEGENLNKPCLSNLLELSILYTLEKIHGKITILTPHTMVGSGDLACVGGEVKQIKQTIFTMSRLVLSELQNNCLQNHITHNGSYKKLRLIAPTIYTLNYQMDGCQCCTQLVFYKIDFFTNAMLKINTVKLCCSRTADTGRNFVLRLRVFV
jgi:hypothetical protein